jgi:transcriptional regulator with XRE-family HTH domain
MSAEILQFPFMANADDLLPNRVRELRKKAGMSLQDVADRLHCSRMQLSNIERGGTELTRTWMKRIAPVLGVAPGDLLLVEDNPNSAADEAERLWLKRFRQASAQERETLLRVADAVRPYDPGPQRREEDAEDAA